MFLHKVADDKMATYGGSKHDWSRKKHSDENEEEEDDPVDSMIKKTGCLELHYKVQVYYNLKFFVCCSLYSISVCKCNQNLAHPMSVVLLLA